MQLKEELQAQEEKTDAIENLNSVLLVKEHMINQELQEARKESIEVWLYFPHFLHAIRQLFRFASSTSKTC
jgi:hypothetical protein